MNLIMKFGTVINCMDGRVQSPVLDYLKKNFDPEFFDTVTEAGPLKILTERTDKCRLTSLKEQIDTSVQIHGSRFLAVVGHHDCAGNPVERDQQERQIDSALDYLKNIYGEGILYVGLFVNEKREVEEYKRMEP